MALTVNTIDAGKTVEIQGTHTGVPYVAFEVLGNRVRMLNILEKSTSDYDAPFIIDGVTAASVQDAVLRINTVTTALYTGLPESVTSLSINANTLSYVDENGDTTDIDLSPYLDDTNLARLTAGTVNPATGEATFTRDDATTFTVDFSALLDAVNADWSATSGTSQILNKPTDVTPLNVQRVYTAQQNTSLTSLADAAAISWDLSLNQNAQVTLGGDRVLENPSNMVAGGKYSLIVKQDITGGRTLSYGDAYKFVGGTEPTLTADPEAVDIFSFISDGTSMYASAQYDLKSVPIVLATNLFTDSENFIPEWTTFQSTITTDAEGNFDRLVSVDSPFGFTPVSPRVSRSLAFSAATEYTFSVYAKAETVDFIYMTIDGASTWFNISGGTIGTTGAGVNASISSEANGYYRCSVNLPSISTGSFAVNMAKTDGGTNFIGTISDTLLIGKVMLNEGPLSPYNPG